MQAQTVLHQVHDRAGDGSHIVRGHAAIMVPAARKVGYPSWLSKLFKRCHRLSANRRTLHAVAGARQRTSRGATIRAYGVRGPCGANGEDAANGHCRDTSAWAIAADFVNVSLLFVL